MRQHLLVTFPQVVKSQSRAAEQGQVGLTGTRAGAAAQGGPAVPGRAETCRQKHSFGRSVVTKGSSREAQHGVCCSSGAVGRGRQQSDALPAPARLRVCQRLPCVMLRQHPASLIYTRDREKNEAFDWVKPPPGTSAEGPEDQDQPALEMSCKPAVSQPRPPAANQTRCTLTPRTYVRGLCKVPGHKRRLRTASAPGQSWNQATGLTGTNKTQASKSHVLPCGWRDAGAQPCPADLGLAVPGHAAAAAGRCPGWERRLGAAVAAVVAAAAHGCWAGARCAQPDAFQAGRRAATTHRKGNKTPAMAAPVLHPQ